MNVAMAGLALRDVAPHESPRAPGTDRIRRMALRARDSHVAAGQGESRLAVVRLSVGRREESVDGMTFPAIPDITFVGELSGVRICMAIGAALELLDFELARDHTILSGRRRRMAFHTGNLRMLPLQGELRSRVGKCRWGEAILRVARLACPAIGVSAELAPVRIPVAIRTALELGDGKPPGRWLPGTGAGGPVALSALQRRMLAPQRESGRPVIKRARRDLHPRVRAMAALASLLELTLVGVGMAGGTVGEVQPRVFDCFPVRKNAGMASRTLHRCMPAGETESGGVMSEPGCRLPPVGTMALLALCRQLATVAVLVACPALLREPEICLACHQRGVTPYIFCHNLARRVALLACENGMLPLEPEADGRMIEGLRIETHKSE